MIDIGPKLQWFLAANKIVKPAAILKAAREDAAYLDNGGDFAEEFVLDDDDPPEYTTYHVKEMAQLLVNTVAFIRHRGVAGRLELVQWQVVPSVIFRLRWVPSHRVLSSEELQRMATP